MKNLNDKEVIELVKNNTKYEIKTTSQDILRAYQTAPKNEKAKKVKHPYLFGSLSALVLSGAIAATVILVNNNSSHNDLPSNDQIFSPITNSNLKKQLLTFSSLTSINNNQGISSLLKTKNLKSNQINESELREIANVYEKIQLSVNEIFNLENIEVYTKEVDFTYNDVTYVYADVFKYKGSEEILATLYHNEINNSKDDDEVITSFEGIYTFNNSYFKAQFIEEKETNINEEEVEITAIFTNLEDINSYTYIVEKESEFENRSSENSFSYTIYESYQDYLRDEDNFIEKIEYEFENNEMEFSYEAKNNDISCEFNNIRPIDNNIYQFEAEYESNSFEGNYIIKVIYNDNNTRTYICNDITLTL